MWPKIERVRLFHYDEYHFFKVTLISVDHQVNKISSYILQFESSDNKLIILC